MLIIVTSPDRFKWFNSPARGHTTGQSLPLYFTRLFRDLNEKIINCFTVTLGRNKQEAIWVMKKGIVIPSDGKVKTKRTASAAGRTVPIAIIKQRQLWRPGWRCAYANRRTNLKIH